MSAQTNRAHATPLRASCRIDVSDAVDLAGPFEIACDLVAPRSALAPAKTSETDPIAVGATPEPAGILVCLPGGYLSRRYFDLSVAGDRSYSFAEAMAQRGFLTLAFDHLGIGESTSPDPIEDGYALGVEAIARANQRALELSLEKLETGTLVPDLAPIPSAPTIGVGHSMGSALSVEQQAASRPHAGLVLFSFTTRGTPAFLNEAQRAYAHQPERARRDLAELARNTMGSPYPPSAINSASGRRAAFGVGTAPPETEEALHEASTRLLALGGLLSMIPGGYAPAAEKIDVPTLVVVGDHDLHNTEGLAEELPLCPDFTALLLEDCWHCHFVSNQREVLWERVENWILNHLPL
jgi:alpha-beta hydrolase superfamily lysophospholipase